MMNPDDITVNQSAIAQAMAAPQQGLLGSANVFDAPALPQSAPMTAPAAPDLGEQLRGALGTALQQYDPAVMANRQKAIEDAMLAREQQLMQEQEKLNKQQKWATLFGIGQVLQGNDPSKFMSAFTERRDAVAKSLSDLKLQREQLPNTLANQRLESLVSMNDAYGTLMKATAPKSQFNTADERMRFAYAKQLFPGLADEEYGDLMYSPEVDKQINTNYASRVGAATTARETAQQPFERPRGGGSGGGGGGGGGLTPNQRNTIISQARQAIAAGADPAAVRQRAAEMGVQF